MQKLKLDDHLLCRRFADQAPAADLKLLTKWIRRKQTTFFEFRIVEDSFALKTGLIRQTLWRRPWVIFRHDRVMLEDWLSFQICSPMRCERPVISIT